MSDLDPQVETYIDHLKQIQSEFAARSFTLVGIDPNYRREPIVEILDTMADFARRHELTFPYLRDTTQDVAKSFGAEVLPSVFLLDDKTRIRYAGSISLAEEVTHNYLRDSINALYSGEGIASASTEPVGSPIVWR
ncbi:redoxin domain-containing protein [Myxosarcina sp. GI1(2024)]